jgi:hypothetical protein
MFNKQSITKNERRLLQLGGVFCAVLALLIGWHYWSNAEPRFNIPAPPQTPSPNGYDYFVKATTVWVPEPDAVILSDKLEPRPDEKNFVAKYPLAARQKWLRQNDEALRLIYEGLKYPALYPSRAAQNQPSGKLRYVAQLFVTQSRIRAAQGDWNGAAQSAIDCIRYGNNVCRGGANLQWLAAYSITASGLDSLQDVAEGVDAPTARNAARQLRELRENAPSLANALQEDKWLHHRSYQDTFRRPDWRQQFAASYARGGATALTIIAMMEGRKLTWYETAQIWLDYWKTQIVMFSFSKRRLLANYDAVADSAIAASKKPYQNTKPAPGRDYFSDAFVRSYQGGIWLQAKTHTHSAMLETALALRAYKLERGAYPASLQNLVPEYLPSVPGDAFNTDKPLRYKRGGATYQLWSIGPDGVDNNGAAVRDTTRPKRGQTTINDNSKGDFVYGVND